MAQGAGLTCVARAESSMLKAESKGRILPARHREPLRRGGRGCSMLDTCEGPRRGAQVHNDARSYLKNADYVQVQEAHLN
jgi:hypothetical protein